MLPVATMVRPDASLGTVTAGTRLPSMIVVFRHRGSVRVELTTYFWIRFGSSAMPVRSSVCFGQ